MAAPTAAAARAASSTGRVEPGHRGDELLLRAVEPPQLNASIRIGGALGGEPLELGAQLVDLLHLAAGGDAHDGAAVRPQLDEAASLELDQRLAHRRAADAEAGAQLVLREALAEPDPALEDVALQAVGDLVGQARRGERRGSADTDIARFVSRYPICLDWIHGCETAPAIRDRRVGEPAPRGLELSCRGWEQEGALRCLMNTLDPAVAEDSARLVVYGGQGKAARSWADHDRIAGALRRLGGDETLLVAVRAPGRRAALAPRRAARADLDRDARARLVGRGGVRAPRGAPG